MRILFMGTPEFAVPSLEALISAGHDVCGAFSQPDKPKGRGMKFQPTPVKACALSHGIPVFQPEKLRDGTALAQIQALAPELIVVAAYGRFLPQEILDMPKRGCINVHSSLLPKYRGAAPIQWAILNGEQETGVTIMDMVAAMDAGDIIAQERTPIGPEETAPTLTARLAILGGRLLVDTIAQIVAGFATRTPQEESLVSLAPMLSRELSPVDWTKSAHVIHCQIRGLLPWPCASTDILTGVPVKLFAAVETHEETGQAPGALLAAGEQGIDVACGDGKVLRLTELQAQGGKRMQAADYLRGHPLRPRGET